MAKCSRDPSSKRICGIWREGRNRWPRAPAIPVQRTAGTSWKIREAVGQDLNITTQSSSLPHGRRELELVGERPSREKSTMDKLIMIRTINLLRCYGLGKWQIMGRCTQSLLHAPSVHQEGGASSYGTLASRSSNSSPTSSHDFGGMG